MRDLVVLGIDPVSGLPQYQSGDRVKTKGLELSADKTWDWGGAACAAAFRCSTKAWNAAWTQE